MKSKRMRTVVIALAVLFAATSCGGDDDTASTQTPEPTATVVAPTATPAPTPLSPTPTAEPGPNRADFIAAGDAICATTRAQFADVELGGDVTLEQLTELVSNEVVPALGDELQQLDALEPPAEDAAAVEAVIGAFREGIDAVEADPISLLTGTPLAAAQGLADDYGFEVCGTGLIPAGPADDGVTPDGFTADQQAVADVVEEFYDGSTTLERGLELLQNADELEADLAATMTNPAASALTTTITEVAFPDDAACAGQGLEPGCAIVTHDLLLSGTVISADTITYAVLEDGQWKVSADSFCEASARAGVPCSS